MAEYLRPIVGHHGKSASKAALGRERMRAFDAVPDGRSDTVVVTTSLPRFPANEQSAADVVDQITTRIYATIGTLRAVHDAVDAEDPSTADILHARLEKLAWLIKSENRKV